MEKAYTVSQLNLFTDNSDVTPESSNLIKLITALSSFKLIPTFGHEIIPTNGDKTQFLRFTNENESLIVNFFGQCINITATHSNKSTSHPESRLPGLIIDVLKKIRPLVSNKKFNRIAGVQSIIYKVDAAEASHIGSLLLKNLEKNGKMPFEWDYRTAYYDKAKTNDEELNIISSIRAGSLGVPQINSGRLFRGIILEVDCNTKQDNTAFRFDFSSLDKDKLIPELLTLSKEVVDHLVNIISGEV